MCEIINEYDIRVINNTLNINLNISANLKI